MMAGGCKVLRFYGYEVVRFYGYEVGRFYGLDGYKVGRL